MMRDSSLPKLWDRVVSKGLELERRLVLIEVPLTTRERLLQEVRTVEENFEGDFLYYKSQFSYSCECIGWLAYWYEALQLTILEVGDKETLKLRPELWAQFVQLRGNISEVWPPELNFYSFIRRWSRVAGKEWKKERRKLMLQYVKNHPEVIQLSADQRWLPMYELEGRVHPSTLMSYVTNFHTKRQIKKARLKLAEELGIL